MKKTIVLLLFTILFTSLNAQDYAPTIYTLKLDNSYLYIDNSEYRWYTLEINADTLFSIQDNMFYVDGRPMQIINTTFNNGQDKGAMGSIKAEKNVLSWHKRWELDFQEENLGIKLKNKEKFYKTDAGKPYLIWWFETPDMPEGQKGAQRSIEIDRNSDDDSTEDEIIEIVEATYNATHNLFLDMIIHGHTCVSVCITVLDNMNLETEIEKLKELANTLTIYGSYIDLDALITRLENENREYVFNDQSGLIEITVPKSLNITERPYDDTFMVSFPEKDGIINAAVIRWEPKTDSYTFDDFQKKYDIKRLDDKSLSVITQEEKKVQIFFTHNNSWFHCQNIYLEGDNVYCFINFTATKDTYKYNLSRFYELVNGIKLK